MTPFHFPIFMKHGCIAAGWMLLVSMTLAGAAGGEDAKTSVPAIKPVRGKEFPRAFTKGVSDFGDWAQLAPLFERLENQIKDVKTPEELDAWLLRRSELDGTIGEEGGRRSIAYTRQTGDAKAEQAYLDFIEKIVPKLSERGNRLDRLYLACPARQQGDRRRMEVYDRNLENDVKLFRQENVPLATACAKLSKTYQKLSGAITVKWQGEEKTQEQMTSLLCDTDRRTREAAWRMVWRRRLQDSAPFNDIFDKLVGLRDQMGRNAGFENFRDYQHQAKNRFDYTPADCLKFDETIAREVVPVLAKIRRERREQMGLKTLRPWDVKAEGSWGRQADSLGRPPLKPFKNGAELEAGCAAIFARLNPELARQFESLRQNGLLDLESRKGKAPGGYSETLDEIRMPFIFMNAAGTHEDALVLLHESGHAFHALACRQEPLLAYRGYPSEIAEVASMSMELFGASQIEVFYKNPEDARRARRDQLESIVHLLPWIARIDAFQQWIYTHPKHTDAQREAAWLELEEKYSPEVDWSGLEAERRAMWQRQLHVFQLPFYYIEYGIAQLGALQLWVQFREKPQETLENYRRALALGGSRPLPQLFQAANIKFDFSEATLRPLMQAISEELDRLK